MHVRAVAFLLVAVGVVSVRLLAQAPARLLDCESTFRPELDASVLEQTFGVQHVGTGKIHTGEGRYHDVTILFPSSAEDKVEIVWKDNSRKRFPAQVWTRGKRSRWRTRSGLTVGMDLRSVETANGRSFRLTGFHWDYAGTVLSWRGGRLDAPTSAACSVRAVFAETSEDSVLSRQVEGDREFSSGHPAMQALNPRIEELWLEYR